MSSTCEMILSLTRLQSLLPLGLIDPKVAITWFEVAEHMMGCNWYPDQILNNGNNIKLYSNNNVNQNNNNITITWFEVAEHMMGLVLQVVTSIGNDTEVDWWI